MILALQTFLYKNIYSKFSPGLSEAGNLKKKDLKYLSENNPRLKLLKNEYKKYSSFKNSIWESFESKVDLKKFRGEAGFLMQSYLNTHEIVRLKYALFAEYVELTDKRNLIKLLGEDNLFGVKLWDVGMDTRVSRDLLDSILEINFLSDSLKLKPADSIKVLDIGAGYGRFAHRFCHAFKNARVTCIDPIATATFICEYYLRFRGLTGKTKVIPFNKIDDLKKTKFNVVVNIHSWTECTYEFICFWLDKIAELNIKYLFIVPHGPDLVSKEVDATKRNYENEIYKRGYKLIVKRSKFSQSKVAVKNSAFPAVYYLFGK